MVLKLTCLVKIKTLLDDLYYLYNKFIETVIKMVPASDKPAVTQNICQLLNSSLINCMVTPVTSEGGVMTTKMYFPPSILPDLWVGLLSFHGNPCQLDMQSWSHKAVVS